MSFSSYYFFSFLLYVSGVKVNASGDAEHHRAAWARRGSWGLSLSAITQARQRCAPHPAGGNVHALHQKCRKLFLEKYVTRYCTPTDTSVSSSTYQHQHQLKQQRFLPVRWLRSSPKQERWCEVSSNFALFCLSGLSRQNELPLSLKVCDINGVCSVFLLLLQEAAAMIDLLIETVRLVYWNSSASHCAPPQCYRQKTYVKVHCTMTHT